MYHIDRNENSDPSSISRRRSGEESRKGSPCLIFRNKPSANAVPPLPWIFYGEEDAPSVLNRNKIPTKYSMDSKSTVSNTNFI